MPFDFDTPIDRRGTVSSKWDKYAGRDILPMWVADMDFRSPPEILDALRRRAEHGIFGYTRPPDELVECVVAMYHRHYDWTVDPDWLVWLPNLSVGLNVVCRAVGQPGDDVLMTTPVYPPFLSAPVNSNRNCITAPLATDGGRWTMDLDAVEKAVTARTRLFLLCNPHNPVGRLYAPDELLPLVGLCERHDLVICSDEVHCQLILDEGRRHVPTATLSAEVAERTITLMAPSKTFNVPGLGCSFAVVPNAELRDRIQNVTRGLVPWGNIFGYTAALAAFSKGDAWLAALLDYLRGNRDLIERTVADIHGMEMAHIEATYLAWIDVRALALDDPVAFFETAGVGPSDGKDFGLAGFVRLNFACPRATLREALSRIRRAVTA